MHSKHGGGKAGYIFSRPLKEPIYTDILPGVSARRIRTEVAVGGGNGRATWASKPQRERPWGMGQVRRRLTTVEVGVGPWFMLRLEFSVRVDDVEALDAPKQVVELASREALVLDLLKAA